jgi:hypothetical protein
MSKFAVANIYYSGRKTIYRTPEAALKAADKREGEGWIVRDEDGKRWEWTDSRHVRACRVK